MLSMPRPHSTGDALAVKVVESVAEHDETDMIDLPPLAQSINPDALNELFDSIEDSDDTETHLSLEYYGHTVQISADHTVTIN